METDGNRVLTTSSRLASATLAFVERFLVFLRDCTSDVGVETASTAGGTGGCEYGVPSILFGARFKAERVTGAILCGKMRILLRFEGKGDGGRCAR